MKKGKENKSIWSRVIATLEIVAAGIIIVMMLHVLSNVISRYLFNYPLIFTQEFVGYIYLPLVAFLGFVVAKHLGEHLQAPLIFDNLTWGNRRILVIVATSLVAVFTALLAYFAFGKSVHAITVHATAGATPVPIWAVLLVPPVVWAILTGYFALEAFRAIRGSIDEETETAIVEHEIEKAGTLT